LPKKEERFKEFIEELTKLSYKYDVVVKSNEVHVLPYETTHIHYEIKVDQEWNSGTLVCSIDPFYWSDENK